MVDKCTAVHCGNDTDRAGGVTVYECNFDGHVDIVKRDIGEMDDVCVTECIQYTCFGP